MKKRSWIFPAFTIVVLLAIASFAQQIGHNAMPIFVVASILATLVLSQLINARTLIKRQTRVISSEG